MTNSKIDLIKIRDDIKEIDSKILKLLSQRRNVVTQVASYKAQTGKPVKDEEREKQLITYLIQFSRDNNLNLTDYFIKDIYKLIIDDSCNYQVNLIDKLLNYK